MTYYTTATNTNGAIRPESLTGKPITIKAPAGYGFVKKRGTMLVRTDRGDCGWMKFALDRELKRCGWPTSKLKVRKHGDSFFVNVGYLRGLDPMALEKALKALPNQCGRREVLKAIEKLPERVEGAAPVRALQPA